MGPHHVPLWGTDTGRTRTLGDLVTILDSGTTHAATNKLLKLEKVS